MCRQRGQPFYLILSPAEFDGYVLALDKACVLEPLAKCPHTVCEDVEVPDANVIGEIGLLTREVAPFQNGEVRFQKPMVGSDVWPCMADEAIPAAVAAAMWNPVYLPLEPT